ncbi:hypothetical protein [Burkholderia phage BCSR5]|nr:hypothetical protein [Burkholderia phage BCSR5]
MDELIPKSKVDFWVKHSQNVMLIGKHGIGKTHIIMQAAKDHGLKLKYFSCATLDPWVDFIGIPKERTMKKGDKKIAYLDLIRPKDFALDRVEFIFLDELNRADPKVLNAVLELVQFRSINGKKFKNLKMIWAAINPPASETGGTIYQVQELDPALMSRFPVKMYLPFDISRSYMRGKYGAQIANAVCGWWKGLAEQVKDDFPPRSVDYALDYLKMGGDVDDCLPSSVSKSQFLQVVGGTYDAEEEEDLVTAGLVSNSGAQDVTRNDLNELCSTASKRRAGQLIIAIRRLAADDLISLYRALSDPYTASTANPIRALLASLNPAQMNMITTNVANGTLKAPLPQLKTPAKAVSHFSNIYPSTIIDETADDIIRSFRSGKTKSSKRLLDDEEDLEDEDEGEEDPDVVKASKIVKGMKLKNGKVIGAKVKAYKKAVKSAADLKREMALADQEIDEKFAKARKSSFKSKMEAAAIDGWFDD